MIAQPFSILSSVIARSEATKQSILSSCSAMDCFASLAMTVATACCSGATSSLWSDRVRSALDEGLQLGNILFLQLAGKVRHAPVAERSLEHDVLQVGDRLGANIAEIPDIAAVVDAGHAVASGTGGDIDGGAFRDILRVILHALQQPFGLVLHEGRQRRLAAD